MPSAIAPLKKSWSAGRWILVLCGYIFVIASVLYIVRGHQVIQAAYENRSLPMLNEIIHGRGIHPVEFYTKKADGIFRILVIGFSTFLLAGMMVQYAGVTLKSISRAWVNLCLASLVSVLSLVGALALYDIYMYQLKGKQAAWHGFNTQFDPEIGWAPVLKGNASTATLKITTNSLGFRSPEVNPAKRHVVILGDSVAYGHLVGDDDTVSAFLQKKLGDTSYQVLNLGVPGYGIDQDLLFLRRNLSHIPNLTHLILIICANNDFEDTSSNSRYGKRKPLYMLRDQHLELTDSPVKKFCFRNILSFSTVLTELSKRNPSVDRLFGKLAGDRMLPEFEAKRILAALLGEIHNIALQSNARFTIVIYPSREDFPKATSMLIRFQNLLQNSPYEVMDYEKILAQNPEIISEVFLDVTHNTSYGNKLAAYNLYQRLFVEEQSGLSDALRSFK